MQQTEISVGGILGGELIELDNKIQVAAIRVKVVASDGTHRIQALDPVLQTKGPQLGKMSIQHVRHARP